MTEVNCHNLSFWDFDNRLIS